MSFKPSIDNIISRFPHEIRLIIFHSLFANLSPQEVIKVENSAGGVRVEFHEMSNTSGYAGALACLNAAMLGKGVAAAAAEALYKSKATFAVESDILCAFLQRCPISKAVQPARYIKKLDFYMDEDPNFVGDGKSGQDLRKADWVALVPGPGDERETRSTKRTQLMRQCWRAILNMPKLQQFEFWIKPDAQGKASRDVFQRFEIRDVIPMHFRLHCKGIDAKIFCRTWDAVKTILEHKTVDPKILNHRLAQYDNFLASTMDIGSCIPYRWAPPTPEKRVIAESIAARPPYYLSRFPVYRVTLRDTLKLQAVRNYDALILYQRRLVADKSLYIYDTLMPKRDANMF